MTDSMDGSLLSVKSVGSKKKGHRRMASKERKAIIADITEDTDQELIPEGNNYRLLYDPGVPLGHIGTVVAISARGRAYMAIQYQYYLEAHLCHIRTFLLHQCKFI